MAVRQILTTIKKGMGGVLIFLDINKDVLDKIKHLFWVPEWVTKDPYVGSHCEISAELLREINPNISLRDIETPSDYACLLNVGAEEYNVPEIVVAPEKGFLIFDVWTRHKKLSKEDVKRIGEFVAKQLQQ